MPNPYIDISNDFKRVSNEFNRLSIEPASILIWKHLSHYFKELSITAAGIVPIGVPNLQQVTDIGAITTNAINTGGITTDYVQLDTTATPTLQPGMFAWNDVDGTANLRLKGGNVTLQLGQETVVRVVNKTGSNLLESQYKVVRVRIASEGGAQGQRLAVVLAQGDNDPDSVTTLGIVTENIANNQEGFITVFGNVNQINTTGSLQGETWVDGDVLYLSPTIPGGLTKVKPTAPNHTVTIGYVVYAHNNQGKIFVKVDNGYELDELHNVLITSPASGQLLRYNGTVWQNWTPNFLTTTPNLNQVTSAGNTTINTITTGGLVLENPFLISTTLHLGTPSTHIDDNFYIKSGGQLYIHANAYSGDPYYTDLFLQSGLTSLSQIRLRGNALTGFIEFTVDNSPAARFFSGGNFAIGTSTNNGYKLDVNGTARVSGNLTVDTNTLFVDAANDRVGIGTTNPSLGKLHVEGTVYSTRFELALAADLASGDKGIRVQDPFGNMYQYNNSGPYVGHFTAYQIRDTSATTMFYATSSAFGIGTTSPTARVHITGGSANWNETTPGTATGTIHLDPETANNDFGNAITFGASDWDNGNNAQAGIYVRSDGNYGTKMYFATTDAYLSGSKTRMYIGHTGLVGIGTTSPTQQLQVTGKVLVGAVDTFGDGNTKLYVHSPTNAVNIVLNPRPTAGDIYYRVKIGVDVSSNGSFYVEHEAQGRIIEAWNSGGYLNLASVVSLGEKKFTLETNGYGLQMYSPFGWSSVVRYTNANSGTTATDGALTGITENGDFRVWTYESHPMLFATANAERMRITNTGDVGIGTLTPNAKLDVQGVVSASMGFKANNQQGINGDITVGGQTFHFEMGILTTIT